MILSETIQQLMILHQIVSFRMSFLYYQKRNIKTDANVTAIVEDANNEVTPIINKKYGIATTGDILQRLHNTPLVKMPLV